jgi:hypothetical protein
MEEGRAMDRDLHSVFLHNLTAIFDAHFKTEDEIKMFFRIVSARY